MAQRGTQKVVERVKAGIGAGRTAAETEMVPHSVVPTRYRRS